MNKLTLLLLVVASTVVANHACHGQNWRDPAFEQPLPQYYPPGRYPPGRYPLGTQEDSTAAPAPTSIPAIARPQPAASPAINTQPLPSTLDSSAVKSHNNFAKDVKSIEDTIRPDSSTRPSARKPVAKRLPPKKSATAKTDKKKQAKSAAPSHPVITYDIYRDGSQFPIDPRKPCSVCRRPVGKCSCGVDHQTCGPGNQGQPYQEQEPGGFACGKNCPTKRPMFSVYWPRPFSAKRAQGHPHRCNCDQCTTRINDRFDHLINFKLIDYQRTDNGYCGPGADPFGCLGESKYQGLGM